MPPAKTQTGEQHPRAVSMRRRVAAVAALLAGAITVILICVALSQNLGAGLIVLATLALAVGLLWQGAMQSGRRQALLFVGAGLSVVASLAMLVKAGLQVDFWAVVGSLSVAVLGWRGAFGARGSAGGRWQPVPPARQPVVLINPHSGDGRAERAALADEARARGITPILLGPDDDLEALAAQAIAGGADVIGMAGGDGSMSVVAAVAAGHGVPFVCVPAGTRNHFALDLGVDRRDLVGALDAFSAGVESRVDLGAVNQRTFVNNVSLGIYAQAVQSPGYRSAKVATLLRTMQSQSQQASAGEGPALLITDDRGHEHRSATVVLVSNNPYALQRALGASTRPRLDTGRLGVVLVGVAGGGSRVWDAAALAVEADGQVPVAIDGEAASLQAPLSFETRPGALRVRISSHHPGVSPSGLLPPRLRVVVPRLVRIALG